MTSLLKGNKNYPWTCHFKEPGIITCTIDPTWWGSIFVFCRKSPQIIRITIVLLCHSLRSAAAPLFCRRDEPGGPLRRNVTAIYPRAHFRGRSSHSRARWATPVHLPSSSSWILEAEESQQRKQRRSPGSRLNTDTTTLSSRLLPPCTVCHLLATRRNACSASLSFFFFAGKEKKKDHKIGEIKWNGCLGMDMSPLQREVELEEMDGSPAALRRTVAAGLFFQTRAIYAAVKTHTHVWTHTHEDTHTHTCLLMSQTLAPDEAIWWMIEPRAESNYGG